MSRAATLTIVATRATAVMIGMDFNGGGIPRCGVQGARAGADLLLFSKQTLNEGVKASDALRRALREGRLDRDGFEESVLRVLRLRNEVRAVPGFKLPSPGPPLAQR